MRGYNRTNEKPTHATARASHNKVEKSDEETPLEKRLSSLIDKEEAVPQADAKPKKRPRIGKPYWSRLRVS